MRIPEQSEKVLQYSLPHFSLRFNRLVYRVLLFNSISAHSNDIGNILKAVSLLLKCCVFANASGYPSTHFFFHQKKVVPLQKEQL